MNIGDEFTSKSKSGVLLRRVVTSIGKFAVEYTYYWNDKIQGYDTYPTDTFFFDHINAGWTYIPYEEEEVL
jgi:hypothetical protein